MSGIKPSPVLVSPEKQRRRSVDKAMFLQGAEAKGAAEISTAVGDFNERASFSDSLDFSTGPNKVLAKHASALKAMEKQGVALSEDAMRVPKKTTSTCCSVQ